MGPYKGSSWVTGTHARDIGMVIGTITRCFGPGYSNQLINREPFLWLMAWVQVVVQTSANIVNWSLNHGTNAWHNGVFVSLTIYITTLLARYI